MTNEPIRIVVPVDVIGDEVPAQYAAALAAAQRAEIHVGLSDLALTEIAARSVYPRRSWWRRLVARVGGAVR